MRWRYILGVALLLVGVCLTLGFFWPFGHSGTELRLPGVMEIQEVRLGSKGGGRVDEVFVAEGDRVKQGDRLVSFEVPELMAQKEQLLAQIRQAEMEQKKAEDGPRTARGRGVPPVVPVGGRTLSAHQAGLPPGGKRPGQERPGSLRGRSEACAARLRPAFARCRSGYGHDGRLRDFPGDTGPERRPNPIRASEVRPGHGWQQTRRH